MNYNLDTILSEFSGLVTFEPDFTANDLDIDLIQISGSKLRFNKGVHPYVTLQNIFAMMPVTSNWTIATYAAGDTYQKGQITNASSVYYESLQDSNIGNTPSSSPLFWKATTLKSVWLRRQMFSSLEKVLTEVVKTDPLIDHELLYVVTDTNDYIDNNSQFVGFEIRPLNSEHLKVVLNRIGTQFTQANTDLKLYLYSQNTKVAELLVDSEANNFSWNTLTENNELYGSGKRWFLFYDQDELTGNALTFDFWVANRVSSFVKFYPFEIPNTTTNFIKDVDGYTSYSYGLSFDLSLLCDITDFITTNKFAFAKAWQLQFCYDMLEMFYYNGSAASNSIERNILNTTQGQDGLLGEIKGENENTIVSKLKVELRRLNKALKFGEVCLPCKDENTFFNITNYG
jgi:hypothetical protein